MQQELNYFTREWHGHTVINPIGLCALVALSLWLLAAPRRWVTLPFIVAACFIAPGQRVVVGSLDFTVLRILILAGAWRIAARGEYRGFRWTTIDVAVVAWSCAGILLFTLQRSSTAAFIGRLGEAYEALGFYFVFRALVRSIDDLRAAILGFAWVAVPVVIAFLIESRTQRNIFSYFGGVPEITFKRDGELRCQGAFAHPILAGCFWATLLPFFLWLRTRTGADRFAGTVGSLCTLLIVYTCSSSTPILSIIGVIAAWAWFPLRALTRLARWSVLGILIALHLSMQAPVWHLLSRINISSGSTGWHRYFLVDRAIYHFNEWWLVGTPTTWHWGPGLVDVTNQYILEAVNGGLLTMVLFTAVLALGFRQSGRMADGVARECTEKRLGWAFGCSFFAHALNFIGVSYFGQITLLWFLTLACVATLSSSGPRRRHVKGPHPRTPAPRRVPFAPLVRALPPQ